MITNNCLKCNMVIPNNHVQQGNMHIGCYESLIKVYKISLDGSYYLDTTLPEDTEDFEIEEINISYGQFHYLPEFQGF